MDQIWVQSNWVQVETEFVLNELLFLAVGMFFLTSWSMHGSSLFYPKKLK